MGTNLYRRFMHSEIANFLGCTQHTSRRIAKEFLPPDEEATQASGKSRKINADAAFRIQLINHLIAEQGYSNSNAKIIYPVIDGYLSENDLYPLKYFTSDDEHIDKDTDYYEEIDIGIDDAELVGGWIKAATEIHINRLLGTTDKFYYKVIKRKDFYPKYTLLDGGDSRLGRKKIVNWGSDDPKNYRLLAKDEYVLDVRLNPTTRGGDSLIDKISLRVIFINELLRNFYVGMLGGFLF